MKTIKILIALCFLFIGGQLFAQNTGLLPYENSTHTYSVTKGTIGTSTLAWTIDVGSDGTEWHVVSGAGTEDITIQWLKAGDYKLRLTETRTDYAGGCPTVREVSIKVVANAFDVFAELNTPADATACATINPSIVVDAGTLGDNSDDVFGTTTRVFKVRSEGLPADVKWEFNYAISHVLDAGIGDYVVTVDPANVEDATANPLVVNAGETEVLITVSYTTNDNRQDKDFNLELVLSAVKDATGTPEKDSAAPTNNTIVYSIKAVPATTGITTD
ncbi:hypothetical protein [Marinifilum fragile]|uniref:hypothetical protein n=1 Tax=Marinifilum fragile TaxID=570161 RepID=UPI002AA8EB4C|nr:hypothetical protein [Marinifilum fragile]